MLAIGAGIVGVAARCIIAKGKSDEQNYDDDRATHNVGKSNSFDDMRSLFTKCRRVMRLYLVRDNGAV